MAIYYNLAKVFAKINGNEALVRSEITLFMEQVPFEMKRLLASIKNKQYPNAAFLAKEIKPALELMGMTIAHDEMILVENWAAKQGKRREIEATVDSIKLHIEKATKEMNKEYKVFEVIKNALDT